MPLDRNNPDFFAAINEMEDRLRTLERSQPSIVASGGGAVNFRGAYNPATTYAADDGVSYNGSSYVCILASTGNLPTNTTYWQILAEKGNVGATGATGADGVIWRGAYNNATAYVPDDAVQYNGTSYICILASTGHLPTDNTYWQIMASKGEQGDVPHSTIYPATAVTLTSGTLNGGNLASMQTFNDGNRYDVQEVSPAGYEIRVDFSGVASFNKLLLNLAYTNASTHVIHIDIYNNTTAAWDTIGVFSGLTGYTQFDLGVIDGVPYIAAGVVKARIFHVSAGNASHSIQIDYIAIENALQGSKGEKGDKGDTGATGATGAKGLNWKAAWSGATAYVVDDAVYYGGQSYIAILAGTNKQPDTNPTYWSLVAQKGADSPTVQYEVGDIYITTAATDPNTRFAGTTWVRFGAGKVLVGYDAADTDYNASEKTSGSKTITLSQAQLPAHYHSVDAPATASGTVSADHTHYDAGHSHGIGCNSFNANGASSIFSENQAVIRTMYTNTGYASLGGISANHTHTTDIAAFNSGSIGSGSAINICQPSIAVFMWKRTA